MFFHFLQARPQGLFISAYLGGMYIRDKHYYKRDSLKSNAKQTVRNQKIKQRSDDFDLDKKKVLDTFEAPFKRNRVKPNFAAFKNFEPKASLYDTSEFENIYPKTEYLRRKKIYDKKLNELEIIAELDFTKELKDKIVENIRSQDNDLELSDPRLANAITLKNIMDIQEGSDPRELSLRLTRQRKADLLAAYLENADPKIKQAIEAFETLERNIFKDTDQETEEYVNEVKTDITPLLDSLKEPLDIAKETSPGAFYVPKDQPVFNPTQDIEKYKKENWNIAIEGEVKPEKSIIPVLGVGIGYLKSLPGHAFAGGEVYCIRPMTTINYSLKIDKPDEEPRGKLDVKVPWSIGASVIAGKCINPYVGLYVKTGMEFTNINFTYTVDNDDIPFGKENKSSNEQKFNLTLKPVFAGFGTMIFGEHWIIAAEYNALTFTKQTIRDYDKVGGDERKRGYAYSGLHHRLLLRLFLIANG